MYQGAPPLLSCCATNQLGQMAVGSEKGDIRLFSGTDKRAKTLLPGLGDAITGIDVTENGSFILATTDHYLLVIPTRLPRDAKQRSGFDVGMKEKPKPIKLQLKHADLIKFGIGNVTFTKASFNTGETIDEEWIVTSTGKYIVTWNFKKVKQGVRDSYKIKCTSDTVVDNVFRFGRDDQVVINMQDNLYVEERAVRKGV